MFEELAAPLPPIRIQCRHCDAGEHFGDSIPLTWSGVHRVEVWVRGEDPADGFNFIGTCPDCESSDAQ